MRAADNNGNGNTALYPKKSEIDRSRKFHCIVTNDLSTLNYLLTFENHWANYQSLKISYRAIFNRYVPDDD